MVDSLVEQVWRRAGSFCEYCRFFQDDYPILGRRLLADDLNGQAAWNFGPDANSCRTVRDIIAEAARHWPAVRWEVDGQTHPPETHTLQLDTSLARERLRWTPVWDWRRAVAETVAWYPAFQNGRVVAQDQLDKYEADAREAQVAWATN